MKGWSASSSRFEKMQLYGEDTVVEIFLERSGLQRVLLASGDRAFVLTDLVPAVAVGDAVVINRSAVDLGLGTGGWHVVHWVHGKSVARRDDASHIMKLRYTSLQHPRLMIEELYEEPDCEIASRLSGARVLVCGLHSQVLVAAMLARHLRPDWRIAYVMTDGAALPIAFADRVQEMLVDGTLSHTITSGSAFGGEFESLNVLSGIAGAIEYLKCDLVIVGMGPGVAGSGTVLGNTAIECAGIMSGCLHLGANTHFALRLSATDQRRRHLGVSHHSRTVLALCDGVQISVPQGFDDTYLRDRKHVVVKQNVSECMTWLASQINVPQSMGRGLGDDPVFYEGVAAAVLGLMH